MAQGRLVLLRNKFLFFGKSILPVLLVCGLLVWLDWVIKLWVQYKIAYGQQIGIFQGLSLVHWHNYGASFGLLADSNGWQRYFFIGVAWVASVGLLIWLFRLPAKARYTRWALGLILSGAIGNVIDRCLQGFVVDYILVHYGEWYWPAFNLADTAICVGVALLLWIQFTRKEE